MPANCRYPIHHQDEPLSEVINTGKASAVLECRLWRVDSHFERVTERSLECSRHDLFMCHVLGSRTRIAATISVDITLENFPISSHRLAVHTQLERIYGIAKFSSMNLLTSPSHVSSIAF